MVVEYIVGTVDEAKHNMVRIIQLIQFIRLAFIFRYP